MQHNFLTTMRSLKLVDGCKPTQVYALNSQQAACEKLSPDRTARANNIRSTVQNSSLVESLLPCGLPSTDLIEPPIDPHLKSVDFVESLAAIHRLLRDSSPSDKAGLYLYQYSVFRALADPKLLRRSLRAARQHAVSIHDKLVAATWLRFERREDELDGAAASECGGRMLECPAAALLPGYDPDSAYDPCPCRQPPAAMATDDVGCATDDECSNDEECSTSADEGDVTFCIGDEEVVCIRHNIAMLSRPFQTMLYGCFTESRRKKINFTQNGISVKAMRAVAKFSRTGRVDMFRPNIVLELLSFANRFCCEEMKSACDRHLVSLVDSIDDAVILIEYGLEERAHLLVASCLQVFLRDIPRSFHQPDVRGLLCSAEGRERLALVGHASFMLYYFLSQVAMEEDMRSNTTVMLLERLGECAAEGWQKQLAAHQLGCIMLGRKEYKDAQRWFEVAAEAGHVYSLAGVARAKYKRGHKYSAYKQTNSLISEYKPVGWMYQERSLYCIGKEKMIDLATATQMDPTLSYPYKYRAIVMMEENKVGAAIVEISKILGFKVSTDCLELRAWFLLANEDYEHALRDIRAMMTLDPDYMMFHGKVHGDQLVEILRQHVQHWDLSDCWMQLYDRWSSVDDIGSLAVVHQMLPLDESRRSVMRFRQSLLLLRLNCQKAAMRSLRLARNLSPSEHERLVYEGWILYDTGHREEALSKAEESISIERSFEAFFLKAYALADTSLDPSSSSTVIELLKEALTCQSDGLRKGQLDDAKTCYQSALDIRHTRAHQGLARVHHLKNQRKAAYDEMTKLIEKARNNASAYEKRSEYCDRDMAKNDLSMATQLDPLRTYPYRYRAADGVVLVNKIKVTWLVGCFHTWYGKVLMDDHKEAEAIAELTKAIAFKPDLQLLHLRAAFHDSMGNAAATLRDCEAALCLDPNHVDTLELYNKACDRKDQHESQQE
ncbi:ethylene-overproduction protein 1 isoform X2 [Magnolia sinica]|uniref:ethylene-overproduction protein 1 isoform X2 n=1 Tax=Magnolia sinica TaxID=86752 RepID=UPI00265AA760|nr:ethylene-overproduction protein 1 isoform X2 [Magnolia sinica]